MSKRLPVIIQNIIYRRKATTFEVLLLKRNEDRGGFWNVVNGTMELNESAIECKKRELFEETGIQEVVSWSEEIHRFSFTLHDDVFTVIVFTAEVGVGQEVVINEEHTEYRWVSFDEAIRMVKFDDDKKGLHKCQEKLVSNEL